MKVTFSVGVAFAQSQTAQMFLFKKGPSSQGANAIDTEENGHLAAGIRGPGEHKGRQLFFLSSYNGN